MSGRGRLLLRGGLVALSVLLLLCLVCLTRRRSLLLAEWQGFRAETPSSAVPSETAAKVSPLQGEAVADAVHTLASLRDELEELDAQAESFRETLEWLRISRQADEVPDMARLKAEEPEQYDSWRRVIAANLYKARRLHAMRDAYLQRLDLTLLTEEERREFQAHVADVEAEEARFLRGERVKEKGEWDEMAERIRHNGDMRRAVVPAVMADKARWGGTAVYGDVLRALAGIIDLEEDLSPEGIRGNFLVAGKVTDGETGETRPARFQVRVEPGWRLEAQEP